MLLSSADWMGRNLHFRIETAFPIYTPEHKKMIIEILKIQLEDNIKARSLNHLTINQFRKNNSGRKMRSQLETYKYLKKRNVDFI